MDAKNLYKFSSTKNLRIIKKSVKVFPFDGKKSLLSTSLQDFLMKLNFSFIIIEY